jgi:hypothetical protein
VLAGRGTDWIDLAKDQSTMSYTNESTTIQRYNTCTQTQLADFATDLPGPCFGHRLVADSLVLVACRVSVVHLSSTGSVLKTFTLTKLGFIEDNSLFAMNLDPDGTTFDHSAGNGLFGGPAVVGELTQAIPTTTTTKAPTTTTTAPPAAKAVSATPAFTG